MAAVPSNRSSHRLQRLGQVPAAPRISPLAIGILRTERPGMLPFPHSKRPIQNHSFTRLHHRPSAFQDNLILCGDLAPSTLRKDNPSIHKLPAASSDNVVSAKSTSLSNTFSRRLDPVRADSPFHNPHGPNHRVVIARHTPHRRDTTTVAIDHSAQFPSSSPPSVFQNCQIPPAFRFSINRTCPPANASSLTTNCCSSRDIHATRKSSGRMTKSHGRAPTHPQHEPLATRLPRPAKRARTTRPAGQCAHPSPNAAPFPRECLDVPRLPRHDRREPPPMPQRTARPTPANATGGARHNVHLARRVRGRVPRGGGVQANMPDERAFHRACVEPT